MDTVDIQIEKKKKANRVIQYRSLMAGGTGFLPFPILDAAGILTIQLWMLRSLANIYGVPFKRHIAKSLIGALVGNISSVSLVKAVPGLGTFLGGGTLAVSSGAATYALGKLFMQHFDQGGTLLSFDPVKSQNYFRELYEEGQRKMTAEETSNLEQAHSKATASTTVLLKANDDLRLTINELQQKLDQAKASQLPPAPVPAPAPAPVPEKKSRPFRWIFRILVILILLTVGSWLLRAAYLRSLDKQGSEIKGAAAPATESVEKPQVVRQAVEAEAKPDTAAGPQAAPSDTATAAPQGAVNPTEVEER